MFLRVVLLLGLVVAAASDGRADSHGTPDNPKIAVNERLSNADQAMALKTAKLLIGYCRPLRKHWADLENLSADVADKARAEGIGFADSHGWGRMVTLTFKVKDNPTSVLPYWRSQGHTIEFLMGGGRFPGIHVQKEVGRWFCHLDFHSELADGDGQYFRPFMALPFIE